MTTSKELKRIAKERSRLLARRHLEEAMLEEGNESWLFSISRIGDDGRMQTTIVTSEFPKERMNECLNGIRGNIQSLSQEVPELPPALEPAVFPWMKPAVGEKGLANE